jgi:hypothetical protein
MSDSLACAHARQIVRDELLCYAKLLARPEWTRKSMPGENRLRLRSTRQLPVKVEACRIPLGAEFIERLRRYDGASREAHLSRMAPCTS